MVERDYYRSVALCRAFNYYYDQLVRQHGGVPGGGGFGGPATSPISPDWPGTFCMPYCE